MSSTQNLIQHFDNKLKEYFAHRRAEAPDVEALFDSMEYSLFNGGKRFRPQLCFAVAEALSVELDRITPFAMALECVHTYSLIHDDLPCMDNDSERRGKPTNHIQFSEDTALLAGDALLTESFHIISRFYPQEGLKLIHLLSEASGCMGMIRGQVIDLGRGKSIDSLSDLIHLHELKTGELIALCFLGPALLCNKPKTPMKELGLMIGLAFQVKDDLLDAEGEELASFISFLGVEGTQIYLETLTEKITTQLKELSLDTELMNKLITFNLNRQQ